MTGEQPFPDNFGGAVYFNFQIAGESKWIFLGKITNQKPSAIFRIGKLTHDNHIGENPFAASMSLMQSTNQVQGVHDAIIGISAELLSTIDSMTPATETQASNLSSFAEYSKKMLDNFFNYASSFAITSNDNQQYVPLMTLQNWFNIFQRRLEQNPNFWKNL
jgi:hypothetical protein